MCIHFVESTSVPSIIHQSFILTLGCNPSIGRLHALCNKIDTFNEESAMVPNGAAIALCLLGHFFDKLLMSNFLSDVYFCGAVSTFCLQYQFA